MPKVSKVLYEKPADPLPHDEEAMKRMHAAAKLMGTAGPAGGKHEPQASRRFLRPKVFMGGVRG